jgi:hypothetical protein
MKAVITNNIFGKNTQLILSLASFILRKLVKARIGVNKASRVIETKIFPVNAEISMIKIT